MKAIRIRSLIRSAVCCLGLGILEAVPKANEPNEPKFELSSAQVFQLIGEAQNRILVLKSGSETDAKLRSSIRLAQIVVCLGTWSNGGGEIDGLFEILQTDPALSSLRVSELITFPDEYEKRLRELGQEGAPPFEAFGTQAQLLSVLSHSASVRIAERKNSKR